jgi:pentose-5-phosphate-3-epimerase
MAGDRILLGVDGGITRDNIAEVARMDVDIIVAGSAIFDGKAPAENLRFMQCAIGK